MEQMTKIQMEYLFDVGRYSFTTKQPRKSLKFHSEYGEIGPLADLIYNEGWDYQESLEKEQAMMPDEKDRAALGEKNG